ncbi:SRPBCC family protein [Nocardia sp. CA-107356]|uniref:SRPBCC family protein n=1 Tax=Nocardia sp. CA-107356 TaxID=3239972 RepID=UPI003D924133
MRNVHEREFPVPAERVGALLARVAEPDSPVWPPDWPPMRLDRPLGVGAQGGHGTVRYRCTEWVPGRRVELTFPPGFLLEGTAVVEVVDGPWPDSCVLRHDMGGRLRGAGLLIWPLALRWLHDAMVEDMLDRTAVSLGLPPVAPARWSPWVSFIRRIMGRRRAAAAQPAR